MKINILLAVVLSLAFAEAGGTEYKYVNYSVPDNFENGKATFFLDVTSKEIRSSDVVDEASICKNNESFFCFSATWIDFHVPKKGVAVGDRWAFGAVAFVVLRKDLIEIFGASRQVWVIEADRSGRFGGIQFFYYSDDDGLLAIKCMGKNSKQIDFFVVAGKKGFPQ